MPLISNNQYTHKEPLLDPRDLRALMDNSSERQLLAVLKIAFGIPKHLQAPNVKICQDEDLVARVASKGWHESLAFLLNNNCGVVSEHNFAERCDDVMWVLIAGLDHSACVRTIVDYMINGVMVDEYAAYEICSNHPQIWPGVADLFDQPIQNKASSWALTAQAEHKDGNYEVILLWALEHELRRISKKDQILKNKAFKQCIYGSYSNFAGCELFDIARWAVMGNLPEVFAAVEETFSKDNPKNQPWVMDAPLGPQQPNASSALRWYAWKNMKLQLAYTYNTHLAHTLLGALITSKADDANRKATWHSDVGVKLWQRTGDWKWLERLRTQSPKTAECILWHLPFEDVAANPGTLLQYKHICEILHDRWFALSRAKHFCSDLFKHAPYEYQQAFVTLDPEYHTLQRKNSEEFHKNLRERQNAVKRPEGIFDTVISGFANPKKKN